MKVICICNLTSVGRIIPGLTLGKIYDVLEHLDNGLSICKIIDDTGSIVWYKFNLFKPLVEWRHEQINKIIK